MACAVIAMIGSATEPMLRRMMRVASRPSITGICTSMTIASYFAPAANANHQKSGGVLQTRGGPCGGDGIVDLTTLNYDWQPLDDPDL
jgi:hypothetical protein